MAIFHCYVSSPEGKNLKKLLRQVRGIQKKHKRSLDSMTTAIASISTYISPAARPFSRTVESKEGPQRESAWKILAILNGTPGSLLVMQGWGGCGCILVNTQKMQRNSLVILSTSTWCAKKCMMNTEYKWTQVCATWRVLNFGPWTCSWATKINPSKNAYGPKMR